MPNEKKVRDCIVCQTAEHAHHYCTIDNQEYVQCGQCRMVYIAHLLDTSELYKAYSGNFLKSLRRKLVAPFRRMKQYPRFEYQKQRAKIIVDYSIGLVSSPSTGEKMNYLDIGCNRGFNLSVAHEHGWNVFGIELVPELIRPFINTYPQYKDHIFSKRFEDAKQELGVSKFDLITAIDVLEHFEDVEKDLKGIGEILKPGGIVVFQTPDTACERALKSKCEWAALKPLEHLNLFDAKNLETLALRCGFSEYSIHKEFEESDGNFVAVLKK